jgi:hypothetical protein
VIRQPFPLYFQYWSFTMYKIISTVLAVALISAPAFAFDDIEINSEALVGQNIAHNLGGTGEVSVIFEGASIISGNALNSGSVTGQVALYDLNISELGLDDDLLAAPEISLSIDNTNVGVYADTGDVGVGDTAVEALLIDIGTDILTEGEAQ